MRFCFAEAVEVYKRLKTVRASSIGNIRVQKRVERQGSQEKGGDLRSKYNPTLTARGERGENREWA